MPSDSSLSVAQLFPKSTVSVWSAAVASVNITVLAPLLFLFDCHILSFPIDLGGQVGLVYLGGRGM